MIFHFIVTPSSISHLIILSDRLFRKCVLAVKISHGYPISINSHFISNGLNGKCCTNSLIASVISYSHLSDILIFSTISIISSLNLYTHKLAKSQTYSLGFSIILNTFHAKSSLKIQYFSGLDTFLTNTQYHFEFISFSKSFFSNILSQFIIKTSNHESIHFIAAAVHFSLHCS
jgi:hypothetical protein